ncbi:MAG: hypothetical protein H6658_04750 [Ardenticatenaceae bacterium]|nr:hypothetical protein [Ardenticatenaceae bacterium]
MGISGGSGMGGDETAFAELQAILGKVIGNFPAHYHEPQPAITLTNLGTGDEAYTWQASLTVLRFGARAAGVLHGVYHS